MNLSHHLIRSSFALLLCLVAPWLPAQTLISGSVNTYTSVSALNTVSNYVTVASNTGFAVGDRVLLIQMQGAQINRSNSAAYGSVTNPGDAGNYELNRICDIQATDIYLEDSLGHSFTPGDGVQLIRVPEYGRARVTSTLLAPAWNGTTGGVIVLSADTLELSASINANGIGFRGGLASNNFYTPSLCTRTDFFYAGTSGLSGRKGEGIAAAIAGEEAGRGAIANGGGGGNHTNSGGGGGGNATAGGLGAIEWGGCSTTSIGGLGGFALPYSTAVDKVFLGGGGGGGHQNDGASTNGGNGGGLIILDVGLLIGNNQTVLADGVSRGFGANGSIDGGGGGGAGGTILLMVDSIAGAVTARARGGQGGSCATNHGPGGGGSGGLVALRQAGVPAGLNIDVTGGATGLANGAARGAQTGAVGDTLTGFALASGNGPVPVCPIVLNRQLDVLQLDQRQDGNWLSWNLNTPGTDILAISLLRFTTDTFSAGTKENSSVLARSLAPLDSFPDRTYRALSDIVVYQLEIQLVSGEIAFSNRVQSSLDIQEKSLRIINPVLDQQLKLAFPGWETGTVNLEILDPSGRLVRSTRLHLGPDRPDWYSWEPNLQPGLYFLAASSRTVPKTIVKILVE